MTELTLLHKLREIRKSKPHGEAFVSYNEKTGRQAISFLDFHILCRRFAFILKEEGVKPGDYIAVTLPVSIETAIVTLGIVLAGAVPASLQMTWKTGSSLIKCLQRIETSLIILRDSQDDDAFTFFKSNLTLSEGEFKDVAKVSRKGLPNLTKAFILKRGGNNDFLTQLRTAKGEYEYEDINGKMTAFMHFTTGSVSDPIKLTEMSHESAVRYCQSMDSHFVKPFKKFLYIQGWFWICGMPFDIFRGATRCIPDDWEPCQDFPKLLYNFIKSEKIRFADIPPAISERIMELWKEDHPKGGEPLLDVYIILGMPITRRMLQLFRPLTNEFILVYGSNECGANHSHHIQSTKVDTFTDFDCGTPMPGVKTKIIDENGQEVSRGDRGRLLLKTPGMFIGFPNQAERTAAHFNKEGWFVTNDRACYDKDTKHLLVGGRIDSLILHGEYMVHSDWIEEMISPHPSVAQVISVPVRDDILFHAIGVCIIKKPGCDITVEDVNMEISKAICGNLQHIFQVKHVLFFDAFPLLADGKVDRSRLYDIVHDKIWNQQ